MQPAIGLREEIQRIDVLSQTIFVGMLAKFVLYFKTTNITVWSQLVWFMIHHVILCYCVLNLFKIYLVDEKYELLRFNGMGGAE